MIPHNIPINGRIAIVDNQPNQARPLMNLFGKLQIPYVYYDGNIRYLPEEGEAYNDVRILFLDINLIDDSRRKDTELKSKLIGVLNRIISQENYPYLLIYWSRHEKEYDDLVRKIFTEDLSAKAPIGYLSLTKSDYFTDDGESTDDQEEAIGNILEKIKNELNKFPIYGHLINWENQIHLSADKTLEEIFKLKNFGDDWNKDAEHLFYKLAIAYSGKRLEKAEAIKQIQSAFLSLNHVFIDSLEYSIENELTGDDYKKLEVTDEKHNLAYVLNKKILFSEDKSPLNIPGIVLQSEIEEEGTDYKELLDGCIKGTIVEEKVAPIRESWNKIYLVITPLCDYAQNKYVFNKIIKGLIINAEFLKQINPYTEAIFISPVFKINEIDKVLILDFRHLVSHKEIPIEGLLPLFRIRQQLLAEIQSKLSRHMNRQGFLFLH